MWACGAEPAGRSCQLLYTHASRDHGGRLLLHTGSVNAAHGPWEGGHVAVSLPRASDSVPAAEEGSEGLKGNTETRITHWEGRQKSLFSLLAWHDGLGAFPHGLLG